MRHGTYKAIYIVRSPLISAPVYVSGIVGYENYLFAVVMAGAMYFRGNKYQHTKDGFLQSHLKMKRNTKISFNS